MKKAITIFIGIFFTGSFLLFAGEGEDEEESWKNEGNLTITFNQAAFNTEWVGGGATNLSTNSRLTYNFNYQKDKYSWDTRVLADFGITKIRGESFERKINDRVEVNSIFGLKIPQSKWAYSFFANFRTQFAKGFDYPENAEGNIIRIERTRFMSPGYLQFGPGFLWKKSNQMKFNITPATARFTFVDNRFTTIPDYQNGDYFGVDAGRSTRFDFGASLSVYAKFQIVKNVFAENILNLYSDYMDEPQNVDIDYTLNIEMKVNKTLSANFVFQAIYDDNVISGFQVREVIGVGVNFGV